MGWELGMGSALEQADHKGEDGNRESGDAQNQGRDEGSLGVPSRRGQARGLNRPVVGPGWLS
jgi:hypothetical protein